MSTPSSVTDPQIPSASGTEPIGNPSDSQQSYAYGPVLQSPHPAESKAFSVASLVLGLASLVFGYTVVVPIVGLVLGILALKREPSNTAMSWWGIALSGVTLFGGAIAVILGIAFFVPLGLAGFFVG